MTKRLKHLWRKGSIMFCLTLLTACTDYNPWRFSEGEGGISPTVKTTTELKKSMTVRSESTLDAPDVDRFGLTLTKSDGSYTKTWSSTSLFPTDQGFKTGTYTMEAFYGSLEDEGFERPYFYGSEQFEVQEDRTANVEITASLANSMVSIAYTDAFQKYFRDWQAKLHSSGGAYIDYPKAEIRPAYIRPGHVDIALSITKPNGVSATLQPASFDAATRHLYRITFDVYEGEVGEAQLRIIFDDTLEEENIEIDLSDELLTAPAPEVHAKGFTAGQPLEILEITKPVNPVSFFIRAQSGISAAILTVNSNANFPLGNEFDFCNLTETQLAQLRNTGIKETGLSRNPGTMAQIDMTEFIGSLPAGNHSFTLVVKDKITKINEPVELIVTSVPLTFEVASVESVPLGSTNGSLTIITNGTELTSALKIQAMDDYGALQDCAIKSITERSAARRNASTAFPAKNYDVSFTLPESSRDIKLLISYKGQKQLEATAKRSIPEYSISNDGFAHKAIIKIEGATAADTKSITNRLRAFCGDTELSISSRNADSGLVTITGLSADKIYTVHTTVMSGTNPSFQAQTVVTTESEASVPNGDFETLHQTFTASALAQGGKYTRTMISSAMQNHQAYTISEPTGWASTNAKTLNPAASTQNSWFVTASVFNSSLFFESTQDTQGGMGGDKSTPSAYQFAAQSGQNAMVIRNVAWDAAGTLPDTDKKTAIPSGYFSSKIPTIANRSAGRLFLGNYSYNGVETISEGVAFTSRPTSLSGYYRYLTDAQDNGEQGMVTVKLMHGNTVIGSGSIYLNAADNFTQFTVPIAYTTYFLKADKLCVMFVSSTRSDSNIKTTSRAERFLQESTGATLVVDNLTFRY